MSIPNGPSFNDSERTRGFHLLTESSHTVKVNTSSVPLQTAHLYPRLAGSNWTCYLNQPCVVLGRSSTLMPSQKRTRHNTVDVDLGDSKAISRRHCEIRFSTRRDRWELYVYGRNGVKINHVIKKPKDGPVVLKSLTLIEIDKTKFVFTLPNNYIKPNNQPSEANTDNEPHQNEELSVDVDLENAIVQLFETQTALNTKELLDKLNDTYGKPVYKENLLHLLVLSQKFELAPTSVSTSFNDSDTVTWMYKPAKEKIDEELFASQDRTVDSQTSTTPTVKLLEREKSSTSALKRLDREKSTHALTPPISLSKLYIDDADWSMGPNLHENFDDIEIDASHDQELSITTDPLVPTVPLAPTPVLFQSLSIASMYSIWTQFQSNQNNEDEESEERPKKRTKTIENNDISTPKEASEEVDIYKQIRTRSLFS